ncbi:hypothetical protein L2E82_44535 [Cichorium intybus]|uniref:Uncharacterized protein n=1 Tax=Cichorium intybus TaxID=13427 RepID=A0ACB8ZQT4_CICIN|nr:hypothetical protein L2E82_44535 [Cichorium intybus]
MQVSYMLPLLKRGIGVHHSGLLHIPKEVTIILFQEGPIKCLFAIETFIIGRRGIADRSVCILMIDEKLEHSTAKMMVKGNVDCLNSAFHLSHNMLLNRLKCEDRKNLLHNSFYQFQADRAIPNLDVETNKGFTGGKGLDSHWEDSLENCYSLLQQHRRGG